ncbi:MAG: hypothetical protein LLG15_01520 [Betaproteobacteria bacterium]|nr:hypothetical protein [Betaproteobacteria bacterium]
MKRTNKIAVAVAGLAALAVSSAQAAVDPAVQTGVTGLVADATTLAGIVTGAVVAIMFLGLGISLVKKMGHKAV